jgi:hypothetical protein
MTTLLHCTKGTPFTSLDFLSDTDAVLEVVKAVSKTPATFRTHLGRILAVGGDSLPSKYKEMFVSLKAEEKERLERHEKTEKEKVKLVPYSRVMEVRAELRQKCMDMISPLTPKEYEIQQTYLMMLLYTEFPPRRCDYAYMDVVPKQEMATDKSMNYYCMDTRKFLFYNYKTHSVYGDQVFDVPEGICVAIEQLTDWRRGDKGCPLFILQNGNRISQPTMTQWLTKAFGSPMGPTALRHIVLGHVFPDTIKDNEKRKDWASKMALSLGEQICYIKDDE